nr:hypothetical protein [Tanacetum cinerariifolium]
MINLKDNVFNRKEKILTFKMSSMMDEIEEDVLDKEAQDNLITVNGPKTDDEFGNGRETNTSDEDVDAEICHPEGGDYPSTEYSTHSFVIQRILLASKVTDSSQRHNLFKPGASSFKRSLILSLMEARRILYQRTSCKNYGYPRKNIPTRTNWLDKSVGDITVIERCKIPFMINKYKDEIMFDTSDMDACHILLGRSWAYDVNATHKGKENTYTFHHDGVKMVLVPLSDVTTLIFQVQRNVRQKGQQMLKLK